MKKSIIILLAIILFMPGKAQSPQVVNTIVKEDKPHEFFVDQAQQWWKEIEKNQKNEEAWYYYYRANRYAQMTWAKSEASQSGKYKDWKEESPFLKEQIDILKLIEKQIPDTYTYYIFKKDGYPDDSERYDALIKAYRLQPENPDTYDELVVWYETNNDLAKRKTINEKWFHSNDLAPGLLNYNYNVLMSMKPGGVLLTFGDNDTFPLWMLQDVFGLRTDVTILNVYLLQIDSYRNRLFDKIKVPHYEMNKEDENQFYTEEITDHIFKNSPMDLPLYVTTPAWKDFKNYDKNLYIIGLVLQYSINSLDNIALLRDNFENKYALDYLQIEFQYNISQSLIDRTNVNYLPGIIKLYDHYQNSGDEQKALEIKNLGLQIASKGGDNWKNKVEEIFK